MKGDPLRSQNHDALKSSTVGPSNKFFFQSFFQTKNFFFQEQFFFQVTTLIQFFMHCKAKKKWSDPNFFENLLQKKRLKGGISIYVILGLLGMYFGAAVVFVTNSHFFQIGCGHTVVSENFLLQNLTVI